MDNKNMPAPEENEDYIPAPSSNDNMSKEDYIPAPSSNDDMPQKSEESNGGFVSNLTAKYNSLSYDRKFIVILISLISLLIVISLVMVIIQVNGGPSNWYGFMIASALILCVAGGIYSATRNGYYKDLIFDYGIIAIPFAFLGTRVYFVLFTVLGAPNQSTFKTFADFWNFIGKPGFAIYGGLLGAIIGIYIAHLIYSFTKKPKVRPTQALDLGFTFIPIGQALGRVGCLLANPGCCYGVEVDAPFQFFPIAYIPNGHGSWHLATPLFETVFCLLLFGFLFYSFFGKRKSFNGFNFSVYCIGYGTCRATLEAFRADPQTLYLWQGGMPVSQFISLIAIAFGVIWISQYIIRAKIAGKKLMILTRKEILSDEYLEYNKTIFANPHQAVNLAS